MNHREMIDDVAKKTGLPKTQVSMVVESVFGSIIYAVKSGDEVTVHGFGKFSPKRSEAREGRNPRTGETVAIAAKVAPKFHPHKGFRDHLNG
jgi:DNA-binding protein HU-beta